MSEFIGYVYMRRGEEHIGRLLKLDTYSTFKIVRIVCGLRRIASGVEWGLDPPIEKHSAWIIHLEAEGFRSEPF